MTIYAVYLTALVIHVVAWPFFNGLIKKNQKWLYWIVGCLPGLAFFLLCVLKADSIGIDTAAYLKQYNIAAQSSSPFESNFEFLYALVQFVFAKAGLPFRLFQIFCYLLICIPLTFVSIKGSSSPGMVILVYSSFGYLIFAFSGLRQSVAMSIFLLAFYLLANKHFWIFTGLIIVASLFHISVLAAIVILPLYWVKYKGQYTIPLVISAFLICLIVADIYETIWWSQSITTIYPPIINYSNFENFIFYVAIFTGMSILLSNSKIVESMNFKFKQIDQVMPRIPDNSATAVADNRRFKDMSLLTFYVGVITSTIAIANFSSLRISYPFLSTAAILIPSAIERQKSKTLRLTLTLIACAILVVYFIYTSCSGYLDAYPYEFCF